MTRKDLALLIGLAGLALTLLFFAFYTQWTVYIPPASSDRMAFGIGISYILILLCLLLLFLAKKKKIGNLSVITSIVVVAINSFVFGLILMSATYGLAALAAKLSSSEPAQQCFEIVKAYRGKFDSLTLRDPLSADGRYQLKLEYKSYLIDVPFLLPGQFIMVTGHRSRFGINVEKIEVTSKCQPFSP